jgi:branched-chain amino acid transport system ATP-binding protein
VPISVPENLLSIKDLNAGYGKLNVLHDVSMTIGHQEIVTLLGPNGAGKTTLLSAISGLLPIQSGLVDFNGQSLAGLSSRDCAKAGLIHVIEGHRIFTQISVYDNLLLAGYDLSSAERKERVEEALAYFPEIAEKRAERGGALSGGQQQMLAVAQGLVRRPRLLMLDEPSAGLSPVLVDRVLGVLELLKSKGVAILLVEQLIEKALSVSDRVYALSQGCVVLAASAKDNGLIEKIEQAYLG